MVFCLLLHAGCKPSWGSYGCLKEGGYVRLNFLLSSYVRVLHPPLPVAPSSQRISSRWIGLLQLGFVPICAVVACHGHVVVWMDSIPMCPVVASTILSSSTVAEDTVRFENLYHFVAVIHRILALTRAFTTPCVSHTVSNSVTVTSVPTAAYLSVRENLYKLCC